MAGARSPRPRSRSSSGSFSPKPRHQADADGPPRCLVLRHQGPAPAKDRRSLRRSQPSISRSASPSTSSLCFDRRTANRWNSPSISGTSTTFDRTPTRSSPASVGARCRATVAGRRTRSNSSAVGRHREARLTRATARYERTLNDGEVSWAAEDRCHHERGTPGRTGVPVAAVLLVSDASLHRRSQFGGMNRLA